MPIIYILKLQNDKYYVGKSNNPDLRIKQHMSGNGSEWTKLYKPEYIVDTIVQTQDFSELAVTLQYMKEYGIDNVRGSEYCSKYLSKKDKQEIEKHIRGEYNLCYTCGKDTHFTRDCKSQKTLYKKLYDWVFSCFKKNINGYYTLPESEIITFGKYKGYSYDYIFQNDKKYCKWIVETSSQNIEFNKFKLFLINK